MRHIGFVVEIGSGPMLRFFNVSRTLLAIGHVSFFCLVSASYLVEPHESGGFLLLFEFTMEKVCGILPHADIGPSCTTSKPNIGLNKKDESTLSKHVMFPGVVQNLPT
jgi:hypothetical protein